MYSTAKHDGNGEDMREYRECPAKPDLEALTNNIILLTDKMENLINLNRDVIRWLLVVVCVIALGRSAIDLGKDFFKGHAHVAEAEVITK